MNFNTVKCNTKEVVHQLFDVLSLAEKWQVGFTNMTFPPVKTIFVQTSQPHRKAQEAQNQRQAESLSALTSHCKVADKGNIIHLKMGIVSGCEISKIMPILKFSESWDMHELRLEPSILKSLRGQRLSSLHIEDASLCHSACLLSVIRCSHQCLDEEYQA